MSSTDSSSREASGLQSKKRGRKSLLGEKTDKALQDYLALVRRAGGVVHSSVMIAAAEGIVSRDYRMHLGKYGGTCVLGQEMGMVSDETDGLFQEKVDKSRSQNPDELRSHQVWLLAKDPVLCL